MRNITTAIIFVACLFLANYFSVNAFAQVPAPDIKANNSDGPVTIEEGEGVNITVTLAALGFAGRTADWWVYAISPFGTFWFTLDSGWVQSDSSVRVYGGKLIDLPTTSVLNIALPNGTYTFNFSVDNNMNDVRGDTYLDSVIVVVSSAGVDGSLGTYFLPDTGQWQSFTDTFGEDSDYIINPPSYTDNGNGTVTDNNTRLMWLQEDDDVTRNWLDSITYCEGMELAGHSDWRLPTLKELAYIVDGGTYAPAINETYFLNTKNLAYWSSTPSVTSASHAWICYFSDGYDSYSAKSSNFYVRCIRGVQNTPDFTDNGDGTVTDNNTRLMWQQEDDDVTRNWVDSITYCEGISLAGHSDWRLPNLKELRSIVKNDEYNPAIDETYFPNTNTNSAYWSSTTYAHENYDVWDVYFLRGEDGSTLNSNGRYVRCIRGGQ